jgi:hypothetical protein
LSLNEISGIRPITIQETQSRLQQKGIEDVLYDLCEVLSVLCSWLLLAAEVAEKPC